MSRWSAEYKAVSYFIYYTKTSTSTLLNLIEYRDANLVQQGDEVVPLLGVLHGSKVERHGGVARRIYAMGMPVNVDAARGR